MNFWESTVSSDNVTRWVRKGSVDCSVIDKIHSLGARDYWTGGRPRKHHVPVQCVLDIPRATLLVSAFFNHIEQVLIVLQVLRFNLSRTNWSQRGLATENTCRVRTPPSSFLTRSNSTFRPWLVEEADKEALITFTEHILANVSQVEGLVAITPDNKTTAADFVNNYNLVSVSINLNKAWLTRSSQTYLGSNHWIGANRIATNPKDGVVDKDTKVFGTDNLVRLSTVFF